MRLAHLLAWIAQQPWAIEPVKAHEILGVLEARTLAGDDDPGESAERIHPSRERALRESDGSTRVIPMHGIMAQRRIAGASTGGGVSTEVTGQAIDAALADSGVKAIILHIDSPGGSVAGTRELAAKVAAGKAQKPIIAQVDSMAASAAYWVASQATEVVVTPGGDVGSIGVVSMHEDISAMLEREGVRRTLITAGKFKAEGHPYAPLTDEARAHFQDRVNEAYRDFVGAVASGRGVATKAVEDHYGQGRMVGAKAAHGVGMVDRVATFEETLARFAARKPQRDFSRQAEAAMAIARS